MKDNSSMSLGSALLGIGLLLPASPLSAEALGSEVDWAASAFFESQVQPILESHCLDCHSLESQPVKGGLYLDSRSGWELGGQSGQVIVPRDPEASLLIHAVRYQDEDLQMPSKGKRLSAEQVAVLEKWVRLGAYDPRVSKMKPKEREVHWAFQPVIEPELPNVEDPDWARNALDFFVLERLEERGLQASKQADKATLIRRAYFDLLGLPPTIDEVRRFEADRSPDGFARLLDRLLASPQYGERWGRHWLDIARYADTKGYVFQEERRFPYSYTYRDYVIDAFNHDLPYDQFIIEQLAADQMDRGGDPRALAGMGFLTLGRRFLNNQHDIIDDRIDVVTRGLMGLTVSCARCHDHKYDPIPAADYYSLYGVFASSQEPGERPLLRYDANSPLYLDYKEELARITAEWNDYRISNQEGALSKAREQTGDYLQVLYDARAMNRSETENLVKERKLGPAIAFRWQKYLSDLAGKQDAIFSPWIEMTKLEAPSQDAATFVVNLSKGNESEGSINGELLARVRESMPQTVSDLASVYGELFASIETEWRERAEGVSNLANPDRDAIRQVMYADGAPTTIPLGQATQLLEVRVQEKIRALKRKVDKLPATHPGAPARAMALEDRSRVVEPVVFLRGKPGSRGPKVPRQFLSVIEGKERTPFQNGSGRLELAEAIASADNPLTSRVIVNRVWAHHFGKALVATPSDFGVRADLPSHPKLLDYLASQFVANGWSMKWLHRFMMLSSTYQQASNTDAWKSKRDVDNTYLWRMNRKRLELEPLRDTLLAVSGELDETMGGQPVEITEPPYSNRRTVYGFIERQNLPGLFRTFNLASPDTSSSGRFETTVPQQALFMVNSPFVQDLARNLEQRILSGGERTQRQRITDLFHAVLQRDPTREERRVAEAFLDSQVETNETGILGAAWQYGYGKVNQAEGRSEVFNPFQVYTRRSWRGGKTLPDEDLDWAHLTPTGGHPGSTEELTVIRRWTAPYSGRFSVEGVLSHGSEEGNGIRAWILGSKNGVLGVWDLQDTSENLSFTSLEMEKGDFLDFAVGSKGDANNDSFKWDIKLRSSASPLLSDSRYWSSKDDFEGPRDPVTPLSSFARLGQVLLMSNELVFVD